MEAGTRAAVDAIEETIAAIWPLADRRA